jgi:hypothetical protein
MRILTEWFFLLFLTNCYSMLQWYKLPTCKTVSTNLGSANTYVFWSLGHLSFWSWTYCRLFCDLRFFEAIFFSAWSMGRESMNSGGQNTPGIGESGISILNFFENSDKCNFEIGFLNYEKFSTFFSTVMMINIKKYIFHHFHFFKRKFLVENKRTLQVQSVLVWSFALMFGTNSICYQRPKACYET